MKLLQIVAFLAGGTMASAETYRVVSEESRFEVHVGRAGLFKMFGHDHVIDVRAFTGTVVWDPADPEASRFELTIDAASLAVADEDLSEDDRTTVQDTMESEALALPEHATISFTSTRVDAKSDGRVEIHGFLDLRGISRELSIPASIEQDGDRVVVRGAVELKSKEWGVPQISALGGSVKTKNELGLEFDIVAVPGP